MRKTYLSLRSIVLEFTVHDFFDALVTLGMIGLPLFRCDIVWPSTIERMWSVPFPGAKPGTGHWKYLIEYWTMPWYLIRTADACGLQPLSSINTCSLESGWTRSRSCILVQLSTWLSKSSARFPYLKVSNAICLAVKKAYFSTESSLFILSQGYRW